VLIAGTNSEVFQRSCGSWICLCSVTYTLAIFR